MHAPRGLPDAAEGQEQGRRQLASRSGPSSKTPHSRDPEVLDCRRARSSPTVAQLVLKLIPTRSRPAASPPPRSAAGARRFRRSTGRGSRRSARARRSCERADVVGDLLGRAGEAAAVAAAIGNAGIVDRRLVGDVELPRNRGPPPRSAASASRDARASRRGGSGEAAIAPTGCQPSPWRAVRRSAAGEWPPTQIGGCGFCSGNGSQRMSA